MFIEDLIEEYAKELEILGIETDVGYTMFEVQEIASRCESYRERKQLLERIETLEKRLDSFEALLLPITEWMKAKKKD